MKIGLVSDVHASPAPLRDALDIFAEHHVDEILCAGDIAGYGNDLDETIDLLIDSDCRSVLGNHDLWYSEDSENDNENPVTNYLRNLPISIDLEITGRQLSMIHASPEGALLDGIRLLNDKGRRIKKKLSYHDNPC